jgi:GNAT superfamily N-acetyltransferase
MDMIEVFELTGGLKQKILTLWNQEYPEQLVYPDIDVFNDYLNSLTHKKHYILKNQGNEIGGWAFLFERENENWFAMILDSRIQGKGYGTTLLKRLQEDEDSLNGWVIDHNRDKKCNQEVYKSPLGFYLKNQFMISHKDRLETDKISAVKISWMKNNKAYHQSSRRPMSR